MSYQGMVVDLQELERFITTLNGFNGELADSTNNITSHFTTLGDAWRDEKYQQFAGEWDTAMHAIDNYLADSPNYVTYLRRKAADVEEYLRG